MFTELTESLQEDQLADEIAADEIALQSEDTDIDQEIGDIYMQEQNEELAEVSYGIDDEMPAESNLAEQAMFLVAESADEEDELEDELADGSITSGDGGDIDEVDNDDQKEKVTPKEAKNIEGEIDKIGEELSHDGEPTE
jgi:hypothetical protein